MVKKNSLKGQMKIQQMMFLILAITLFFVLVGLFLLTTNLSSMKQKATSLQEENARLLVSRIADSPEFSCGNSFGTSMSSCIDLDKVMGLKSSLESYGNGNFWGISGLEIVKTYPENPGIECTSENFPNCGKITLINSTNGTGVSNFVSLCEFDSINGSPYPRCFIGEAIVTYQTA